MVVRYCLNKKHMTQMAHFSAKNFSNDLVKMHKAAELKAQPQIVLMFGENVLDAFKNSYQAAL